MRWTLRAIVAVALASACYLAWVSLQGGGAMIGCAGLPHFDCEHVITSRWSYWFGLPVSVAAVAVYSAILAATCLIGPRWPLGLQRASWAALLLLTVMAAGAALWFIGMLTFVTEKLCLWCLIVHVCGLTTAGVVLSLVLLSRKAYAPSPWLPGTMHVGSEPDAPQPVPQPVPVKYPIGFAAAGVAGLIFGQLVSAPPPTYKIEQFEDIVSASAEPVTRPPAPPSRGETPGTPRPEWPPREPVPPPLPERPDAEPRPVPSVPSFFLPDDPELPGHSPSVPDAPFLPPDDPEPPVLNPPIAEPPLLPPKPSALDPPAVELPNPSPPIEAIPAAGPSPGHRRVTILGGSAVLDTRAYPVFGRLDAPYTIVNMSDYTCKHCRTLHQQLQEARKRYGEQFAIVFLTVPLNTACNGYVEYTHEDHRDACKFARLAVAVWRLDRTKFETFHHWLYQPERPPSVADATVKAAELVGDAALKQELADPAVDEAIRHHTQLFKLAKAGALPKLLFGKYAVSGRIDDPQKLFDLLEEYWGVKPSE